MVNTIIMAYFTYNVHLKANENRSMSCMTYALHFTSLRIYYIYIEEHTHDMHTKWTLKITEKRQQKQQLWKKNPLNVVRMPPNFEFSCNSRVNKCKLNKYVCVKCRFGYSLCVFFFSRMSLVVVLIWIFFRVFLNWGYCALLHVIPMLNK